MHSFFEDTMEYTKAMTKFVFDTIANVGKNHDLSRMESHALLFFFIRGGRAKANDFIKCGSYSKSNVSKAFDKLNKLGYLELKALESDRRFQIAILTKEGYEIGKEIGEKVHPIMDKLREGISEEEREVILKVGAKLKNNIDSILKEVEKQ